MKRIVYTLAILAITLSCEKEEVVDTPTIVRDRAEVENNIIGTWKGEITASQRPDETVEVVILGEMNIGNKVAEGKVYNASFACDFEWTYEAFNEGRVIFREKTLNPAVCYDDVEVAANFSSDSFDELHLRIPIDNYFFTGTLIRQ